MLVQIVLSISQVWQQLGQIDAKQVGFVSNYVQKTYFMDSFLNWSGPSAALDGPQVFDPTSSVKPSKHMSFTRAYAPCSPKLEEIVVSRSFKTIHPGIYPSKKDTANPLLFNKLVYAHPCPCTMMVSRKSRSELGVYLVHLCK